MKSYAEIDQEIKAVKGESGQNSEELAAVTSSLAEYHDELKAIKASWRSTADDMKLLKEFQKSRDEIVQHQGRGGRPTASDIKTIKDFIADYKDEMDSIRGLMDQDSRTTRSR